MKYAHNFGALFRFDDNDSKYHPKLDRVQQFIQVTNIAQALYHWPLWGESTGPPSQRANDVESVYMSLYNRESIFFHMMQALNTTSGSLVLNMANNWWLQWKGILPGDIT